MPNLVDAIYDGLEQGKCAELGPLVLELVQAIIILFFVVDSFEGVSSRARCLLAQAIAMGRELALHAIDDPSSPASSDLAQANSVKAEIGRTDVLPVLRAARGDANANDEDVVEGARIIDRPLQEPTSVSYLYHGLLDRRLSVPLSLETMDYGQVMEIDRTLKQFVQEMPSFFSLDSTKLGRLPPTDPRRGFSFTVQRYTLKILLHRQLCKLHLPYLARATVQPAFAYCHAECLRSARLIIYIEHQLRRGNLPFLSFRQRTNMVLRGVYVSCIALVLNACLGTDSQGRAASGEVMADAWSILHEAGDQSPLASRLLELSIQVLRRHKATHPALEALKTQPLLWPPSQGEPLR